jgi:hypothetical protein
MEIQEQIKEHERRIKVLEEKIEHLLGKPAQIVTAFSFVDKSKSHTDLLEELLKSEYCHYKNGLTFDEIIDIFSSNRRPVIPKKIRDLLSVWKKRGKIEALKNDGKLKFFWIENGN